MSDPVDTFSMGLFMSAATKTFGLASEIQRPHPACQKASVIGNNHVAFGQNRCPKRLCAPAQASVRAICGKVRGVTCFVANQEHFLETLVACDDPYAPTFTSSTGKNLRRAVCHTTCRLLKQG